MEQRKKRGEVKEEVAEVLVVCMDSLVLSCFSSKTEKKQLQELHTSEEEREKEGGMEGGGGGGVVEREVREGGREETPHTSQLSCRCVMPVSDSLILTGSSDHRHTVLAVRK